MGGIIKNVLNAQKLIDWMLEEHDIISREEGVALGREFVATGVLRHGEKPVLSGLVCILNIFTYSGE